jgi:N-acyl-D-aspartate/D-glutamate deacylase
MRHLRLWRRSYRVNHAAEGRSKFIIERRDWADRPALVEEIARERRCDPLDAVGDVIIADKGATPIVVRSMSEADVRAIAADCIYVRPSASGRCRPPGTNLSCESDSRLAMSAWIGARELAPLNWHS